MSSSQLEENFSFSLALNFRGAIHNPGKITATYFFFFSPTFPDSPKEVKKKRRMSNQSPKKSSQPRRRSSRLSPPADHMASKVAENSILKPRCVNTSNWEFTHQSKHFKVPSKNATSKLRRSSGEKSSGKVSFQATQVLCPLRHGPKEVCTICMARYLKLFFINNFLFKGTGYDLGFQKLATSILVHVCCQT